MGLKGMTIVIIKLNNTFILSTEIVTKRMVLFPFIKITIEVLPTIMTYFLLFFYICDFLVHLCYSLHIHTADI